MSCRAIDRLSLSLSLSLDTREHTALIVRFRVGCASRAGGSVETEYYLVMGVTGMVCVCGLLDRVEERRVRGTAEVSVAVEATAVWSRLFLYFDIRARGYVSTNTISR